MINTYSGPGVESPGFCQLKAGDILLVHTKHSLWGWLIRHGTHCYWNHALVVYSSGDSEHDFDGTLAVDAKTNGTIVLSRASEYLNRPEKYDVAVMRMDTDWFQDDQTASLDFRSHICNIAVNEVDFKVGSPLMDAVDQIIRQLTVVFRFVRRKIRRVYTPPNLPWNIRPIEFKAFTCGGFVQWCYYHGVSRALQQRGLGRSLLDEVVFNPRVKGEPTAFELLTTTPADLANSRRLSWKYVILDGRPQEVKGVPDAAFLRALTQTSH